MLAANILKEIQKSLSRYAIKVEHSDSGQGCVFFLFIDQNYFFKINNYLMLLNSLNMDNHLNTLGYKILTLSDTKNIDIAKILLTGT